MVAAADQSNRSSQTSSRRDAPFEQHRSKNDWIRSRLLQCLVWSVRVKTTPTDVHLANVFYDQLLGHARKYPGKPIRYGDLVAKAKAAHPIDGMVQSAIPVSTGRRLELIVQFVAANQLPPLTAIVVNSTGYPGHSYKPVNGSWKADMDSVAAYDWSQWQGAWQVYVKTVNKHAAPMRRRTETVSRELVHEQWTLGNLPKLELDTKERLVDLLRDGMAFEDALADLVTAAPKA